MSVHIATAQSKVIKSVLFAMETQLNNNNNNGNFYSALPIKIFTAQGAYKSDANNNNITQTHKYRYTGVV